MLVDTILSFDLETTGFSPTKNEILEIGALVYNTRTKESKHFSWLIKVSNLPDSITEMTGITKGMTEQDGVELKEALKQFKDLFTGNLLVVGHNVLRFDLGFLKKQNEPFWSSLDSRFKFWDTLAFHREKRAPKRAKQAQKADSGSLESLCARYSIKRDTKHRALPDAIATFEVFLKQYSTNKLGIIFATAPLHK